MGTRVARETAQPRSSCEWSFALRNKIEHRRNGDIIAVNSLVANFFSCNRAHSIRNDARRRKICSTVTQPAIKGSPPSGILKSTRRHMLLSRKSPGYPNDIFMHAHFIFTLFSSYMLVKRGHSLKRAATECVVYVLTDVRIRQLLALI